MTFAEIMLIALTAFTAAGSFCFAAVMAVREIWGGSHCDEKESGMAGVRRQLHSCLLYTSRCV